MAMNDHQTIQPGEWIWRERFLSNSDCFMFARKTFTLDAVPGEANLWIAANSVYQLFINGKLIGFGPGYKGTEYSFADSYNVSYYLQPAANTIEVLVYHCALPDEYDVRPRGLFCQLEIDGKFYLGTDRSWQTMEGFCYQNSRARSTPDSYFNEYINMRILPSNWVSEESEDKLAATHWSEPTQIISTTAYGAAVQPSPISANSCDENGEFTPVAWGNIKEREAYTYCSFGRIFAGSPAVYAARAYVYAGEDSEVPIRIICDDRHVFFNNHTMISSTIDAEQSPAATETVLPLRKGWNCLQMIQQVRENSMGFALAFPAVSANNLSLHSQPSEKGAAAWEMVGPLKMPLEDATPSIDYAKLARDTFQPSPDNITDAFSWLHCCEFQPLKLEDAPEDLASGQFLTLKLDQLRIGFPVLTMHGEDGDIVDVTIGNRLNAAGLPILDDKSRCTHTLELRARDNAFIKFLPVDCTYLQVVVRKAKNKVRIINCVFNEIVRPQKFETQFTCSDDVLNDIWQVGQEVMRRNVNQTYRFAHSEDESMYMLDSYGLSANMICAFGDYHFSELMLRVFARIQFENGNIPAMSSSGRCKTQINHMAFFPMWLAYHYRTSGNEQLVRELLPTLDMAVQFFESLVDDKVGMIVDIDKKFRIHCEINDNVEDYSGCSTDVNSLYCRFLLSAAEIYRIAGQEDKADKCMEVANRIVRLLHACCWVPSEKVFCDSFCEGHEEISCNSFTNMLALFAGVKSPDEYLDYLNYFFINDPPSSGYPEQTKSSYFNFLFTYTMFALRQTDWTLRYLKDYWASRIDYNAKAWKEAPDSDNLSEMTMSKGNMIGPNIFLVREAAGVRAAEPGFTAIYFNPPFRSLKWANLSLQTVNGKLLVKWQVEADGSLDVTINANFPLKVLSEFSSEVMEKTTFRISENITLLDPESKK
jgi:hypothetical protein